MKEYVGAIVLEVDGREYEVIDFNSDNQSGRKVVKTMNRTGRAKGFSRGVAEYDLSMTVAIPLTSDIDWESVENAKITVFPASEGGRRESYLDCFTLEVGAKYSVDNEARRDIKMASLRKVTE